MLFKAEEGLLSSSKQIALLGEMIRMRAEYGIRNGEQSANDLVSAHTLNWKCRSELDQS